MATDRLALPVTTTSTVALDAYDEGVHGLLGWDGATLGMFNRALEADPDFALAHAGVGVCHFLDERFADARAAVERARAAVAGATPRERGHVEAMAQLIAGRPEQAERAMREHLTAYPRDLAVAQRLYFIWFWQGRFPEMLALTGDLVRHYPGNSFMLGLRAFALEEAQRLPEAFATAEVAVARNPRDAWSIHALAHTVYEMGAARAGISLLPPAIHPCTHLGWFRNHLLWHLALMHFACGDYARASRMSRAAFERAPSSIPGNLHDSISLLWRLALVGGRGRALAALRGYRSRAARSAGLAVPRCASGHGAGRSGGLVDSRAATRDGPRSGRQGPDWSGGRGTRSAHRGSSRVRERRLSARGRAHRAAARAHREPGRQPRPQRDVFHDTLLEACFRACDAPRAQRLLAERVTRRPDACWLTRTFRHGPVAS